MKWVLKLEELAMWTGCILLFYSIQVAWWWYLLLFIGPDVSMLGYALNERAGAFCYNLFHHKGLSILVLLLGIAVQIPGEVDYTTWWICLGICLFGHSSMDRFFGYGLKYQNGFKFTHLGEIGKK